MNAPDRSADLVSSPALEGFCGFLFDAGSG